MLVDPLRLEQALNNLVSNAVKFTPDSGEITLGVHQDGPNVHVSVTDTGTGIDPADVDRIFGRFYRTKTATDAAMKGSGLGLAIAKRMIEAQNGQLRGHERARARFDVHHDPAARDPELQATS